MKHTSATISLISIIILFLSGACSTESYIVKNYLENVYKPAILITSPDFIYKSNLKSDSIIGFNKLSEDQKDSALYYSSKFIQWINDSVVFLNFFSEMEKELKILGYEVYMQDQLDTFLTLKEPALIFDIAQIELEEYILKVKEEEVFDDTMYYFKEFNLNAINMNTWFELSQLNAVSNNRVILYSSHYVFDHLKGRFAKHTISGEVKYRYTKKVMNLEDVYTLSKVLGRKYGSYLNDYLMNLYLTSELPESAYVEKYYHYDRSAKKIRPAYDDKFIILEDDE